MWGGFQALPGRSRKLHGLQGPPGVQAPTWRGGRGVSCDLNALRLDASANVNGIWALKPCYLGPWTPRDCFQALQPSGLESLVGSLCVNSGCLWLVGLGVQGPMCPGLVGLGVQGPMCPFAAALVLVKLGGAVQGSG